METTKIKALLLAAKYQTLSRAAETFSYTPSALSHMTDALEDELGVKLLVRTRSGVYLTKEGELLRKKMEALLLAEEDLMATATALKSNQTLELRIGSYSSISTYLLPGIVKQFKKEHPNIHVSITVADSLRGWLENDKADVIFGDQTAIEENEHRIIMKDRFVAVLQKDLLPQKKSITKNELYPYPYISTNESVLRRYFDENQFAEILRFDSVDDTSVLSMVKEGIGVAVLTSLATRRTERGVRILKLTPEISRLIGFAYRKKTPVIEQFLEFMTRYKI